MKKQNKIYKVVEEPFSFKSLLSWTVSPSTRVLPLV